MNTDTNIDSSLFKVLENLFLLNSALATEEALEVPRTGKSGQTIISYFSGILGFGPAGEGFCIARRYTPILSALIYNLRLTFLELAVPLYSYSRHDYKTGYPKRRSLNRQHQRLVLTEIGERCIGIGSSAPLADFIDLRGYGKTIACRDPPPYYLSWSDDGQTVTYNDKFSLTMQDFRNLSKYFILSAQESSLALLCGLPVPAVDLAKIKDDITNRKVGHSFVKDSSNHVSSVSGCFFIPLF